jgi:hypothetical protein
MKTNLARYWHLFAAISVMLVLTIIPIILVEGSTGEKYTYPIDDAYVHMALARNLMRFRTWGALPVPEFTSSSSSLLWTVLLVLIGSIFGLQNLTPLVVNFVISILLLIVIDRLLLRIEKQAWLRLIILLLVIACVPLPMMVAVGMEHTLHLLLTIVYLFVAVDVLTDTPSPVLTRNSIHLLVLTPLLTCARLEGIFLVFMACVLLCVRRRFVLALLIGTAAWLPYVIYGYYSLSQGWPFLPAPILLKTLEPVPLLRKLRFFVNLIVAPRLAVLLGVLAVTFILMKCLKTWQPSLRDRLMMQLFGGTLLLHIQFARTGWFHRYEAYLMGTGVVVLGTVLLPRIRGSGVLRNLSQLTRRLAAAAVAMILVLIGFTWTPQMVEASESVFYQHIQMARFIRAYHNHSTVVVNDIGAVAYFSEANYLDVIGLANQNIATIRLTEESPNSKILEYIESENASIAMIYAVPGYLIPPADWIKIADWITPDGTPALTTVSFYAVDPAQEDLLRREIKEFESDLPSAVTVHYADN